MRGRGVKIVDLAASCRTPSTREYGNPVGQGQGAERCLEDRSHQRLHRDQEEDPDAQAAHRSKPARLDEPELHPQEDEQDRPSVTVLAAPERFAPNL